MSLAKGDKLFKFRHGTHPQTTVIDKMRGWLANNPEATEISDRDLAEILCPNESYVIHEVMTDVHYQSHADGFSLAPSVDLKVLY